MACNMKVHELAAFYNVSEETVRRLAREGKIPNVKMGREFRFSQQDVHRALSLSNTDDGRKR